MIFHRFAIFVLMKSLYLNLTTNELSVSAQQVSAIQSLLDQGATVPFIARYRKELTGNLDEVAILQIKDKIQYYELIEQRKEFILSTIESQGKLTPELEKSINEATDVSTLEDLYLPYKPKRKTRATKAKDKGLEPLAEAIYKQGNQDPALLAENYLNEEVLNIEEALQGARDIIAEWISEDSTVRDKIRSLFKRNAVLTSSVIKTKADEKYRDYFEYDELLKEAPSHRLLAIFRGEQEGVLRTDISIEEDDANRVVQRIILKSHNACGEEVEAAIKDSYKRLIKPSIETEFRNTAKEFADDEAINVFQENLRQLLLSAPYGQHVTLALDPGFRTGCKLVVLDQYGSLLEKDAIFPHPPQMRKSEAAETLKHYCRKHKVEAIAIGNGTAGRETETFVRKLEFTKDLKIFLISESGASIYSASEVARDEFPNEDVTVRGAVSIGRRLMDPLAELVKIDPKSIGVGQYQHDVDQKKLKGSLDQVVESCVNQVGVNVNTASKHLLSYVAGLGPKIAENIVEYRSKIGGYKSRKEFLKVPKLGKVAFEQAAGFLRIPNAKHILDSSAVHPERYELVELIARDLNCQIEELVKNPILRKKIDIRKYQSAEVGIYTLQDIMNELEKPGRDPREILEEFKFADIHSMDDLWEGMVVPGIVTNITKFGAFVDIGVKQDGLLHISQMADKFIKDPNEVVKLQQKLNVRIIEVDKMRKRISLSLKSE